MPARRTLHLCIEEREALEDLRDHAPKPYLRERAAAFLLIASGVPPAVVARERLLRPRHPETVYLWLNRWEAEGIDSLPIRDGRGRKPAFSP
ncbi:helix-turn-helix domain-containing protein [Roseiflexus sp.]